MGLLRRGFGWASRRLERPELVAVAYSGARRELHEEIAIKAVIGSALRGDGVYVDVGSNRGQVLAEAVRAAPRARHLAFEPIPELAAEIRAAFPGVECRELALGAAAGRAEFCHFRKLDGWSGLRRSPVISDERGDPEYIEVQVSTLDDQLGDLDPTIVKIDVEGAELDVLEGGRSMLARAKPLLIFEHVASASALYGAAPDAPWELLAECGYDVLSVTGAGPFTRDAFAAEEDVVNWVARPRANGARGSA